MRKWKRCIIAGLLTLWLGNGFLAALAFKQAMPALNWKGQTFIGLTWPVAMACHFTGDRASVCGWIPPPPKYSQYLFTFDEVQP